VFSFCLILSYSSTVCWREEKRKERVEKPRELEEAFVRERDELNILEFVR
jgi:hypothetical protein